MNLYIHFPTDYFTTINQGFTIPITKATVNTKSIKIKVLGIRNHIAHVSKTGQFIQDKNPGYVNMKLNHLISVPAGAEQLINPRFIIHKDHHMFFTMKKEFFA